MRHVVTTLCAVTALACSEPTTSASHPWAGVWTLQSVDGLTLPAPTTSGGYAGRVVSRSLDVWIDGNGLWEDSSLSQLLCIPPTTTGPMCNASGRSTFLWNVVADTLFFTRVEALTSGYVVASKTFVMQPDSSLRKTDDSRTEVYRR